MPRSKPVFKKRCGFGRKKAEKPLDTPCTPEAATTVEASSDTDDVLSISSNSSSHSKIEPFLSEYEQFDNSDKFDIVNISNISKIMNTIASCKSCSGLLHMEVTKRFGLAAEIEIICLNCNERATFCNSEKIILEDKGNVRFSYAINAREIYAMRTIGKGYTGARTFNAIMNLPPPPVKFSRYENAIKLAAQHVCEQTMRGAVMETIELEKSRDISVALDGTWQKRGHTSQNGVVTAISIDTGKAIDVAILSKSCRCPGRLKNDHTDNCLANYSGTSGGMEVAGAKQIFGRSLDLHQVRYKYYLGDGDSKGYKSVVASKPYGPDFIIEKLECINHVEKRMGTRLKNLKNVLKGTKLADGKSIAGRNRLTDKVVEKIQKYYGAAIRENKNNLEKMRKAVWAIYFHLISSDNRPVHELCCISWCKYRQDPPTYKHNKHLHLEDTIMEQMKPIFKDLSNPALLGRCLHGTTQNSNESLNNVIWARVPKRSFVMLNTLELGTYEALATFNEGNIVRCRIMRRLGIEPGFFFCQQMQLLDKQRIQEADSIILAAEKKSKQRKGLVRKKLEESFKRAEDESESGPSYGAGMH